MATMTQVKIEVESGASRFLVSVRAPTVPRALRLVGTINPGASVRVVPSDPEARVVWRTEREQAPAAGTSGSAA